MSEENITSSLTTDETYQECILQDVSRTFALTIPQLPGQLRRVVSNAYLLCRIADTIEDDRHMPYAVKRDFSESFIKVVKAEYPAEDFARNLVEQLSDSNTDAELDLIRNTAAVIRITHSFNNRQHTALSRCVGIMADGMARFQESNVANGLRDQDEMDDYCYHVAGVVGEMLTELFCDYSGDLNRHYERLFKLSVSFGQGLQMTNILKDIWDDQKRNMCWLPRSVFEANGSSIDALKRGDKDDNFQAAMGHLIGVAHAHLENALEYTLLIPPHESGMRRFCLYALGMAVLTLRKINSCRDFSSGQEVKISRNSVRATIMTTNLFVKNDRVLKYLFNALGRDLPVQPLSGSCAPVPERL